ncbi:unnamed protein product [Amoebophrya sp. A25]|nr:unnamed protein product [Amoebophrya sp. A25]|eukprot:GSA25T00017595001.1
MIHHPQSVIYEQLGCLLHQLSTRHPCVDIRDRSLYYMRLLYFVSASTYRRKLLAADGNDACDEIERVSCGTTEESSDSPDDDSRSEGILADGVFADDGEDDASTTDYDETDRLEDADHQGLNSSTFRSRNSIRRNRSNIKETSRTACYDLEAPSAGVSGENHVVVLPTTIRLAGGPVPFLSFSKSLTERRSLGLMDGQCAVFQPRTQSDCASELMADPKVQKNENIGKVQLQSLRHYRRCVPRGMQIRLPFRLRFFDGSSSSNDHSTGDKGDFPDEIFSLEIRFALPAKRTFVPLDEVYVPFMARGSKAEAILAEKEISSDSDEFPHRYKLLLKVEVVEPVLQIVDVNLTFSDARGNTYFGALESFAVSFQDFFLPIPRCFDVAHVFFLLWSAFECSCATDSISSADEAASQEEGALPSSSSSLGSPLEQGGGATRSRQKHEHCEENLFGQDEDLELVQSIKIFFENRERIHRRIRELLWPFVVPEEDLDALEACTRLEPEDYDFEQELHFDRTFTDDVDPAPRVFNPASKSRKGEQSYDTKSDQFGKLPQNTRERAWADTRGHSSASGHQLNLETCCVLIFIPPKYHLALRFTIFDDTTVCRIRTDRRELLSYLDTFFWADFLHPRSLTQ